MTALYVEIMAAREIITPEQADNFRQKISAGEEDIVFEHLGEILRPAT